MSTYNNGSGNVPRLPKRVVDTLINSAGVSDYHPRGSQLSKLHDLAHGVAEELLARLPSAIAQRAPADEAPLDPVAETLMRAGHERAEAIKMAAESRARMADEAQGAVAVVDEGDDGLFVDILNGPNGTSLKRGDKLYTHAQPTAEEAPDAAMLLEVIRTVRQYPDFDDESSPFGVMMDEALAGKRPALLDTIDSLANGRRPTVEEVTNEPFYWLEAEESARGSDPRDVFGKHSMLYSTRMSKDKPIGSNPCWPLYLHPAPKVSRTDHLQKIIAYAYQIAGAHDAPEHILDVLADPEAATDEQVEAMLPYVPQPDRSRPSGNAGEGAAGEFKALWNNCDCHPATCACDAWAVYAPNGKRHSTYGSKVAAEEMAVLLSPKSAAPAFNQSEFATMDDYKQAKAEHAKRAEPDERALFEAWALGPDGDWLYVTRSKRCGVYEEPEIEEQWKGWKARAALQQQAGVPEGWQVVPKEPTEAMVHAAEDVPTPRPFGKVYRAMIAAAPTLGGARDD